MADGAASNFRFQFTSRNPVAKSRFWGLELIDVALPTYGLAYGVIGSGPPILIYQISSRITRILIDIPTSVQNTISGSGNIQDYIKNTVVPTLPEVVRPTVMAALEASQLRSMPNSWLPPSRNRTAGLLMLGDSLNMRHPLTGGGMTVALHDIVMLSKMLSPNRIPSLSEIKSVLRIMQSFHWNRKKHSMSLNILAQALYTLFVADGMSSVFRRSFMRLN